METRYFKGTGSEHGQQWKAEGEALYLWLAVSKRWVKSVLTLRDMTINPSVTETDAEGRPLKD